MRIGRKISVIRFNVWILFFFIAMPHFAYGRSMYIDPEVERYQEYNPDGKKYEFVRSYLNGLNYIYVNDLKNQENYELTFEYLENPSNLVKLRDDLVMNNINLRIARNFVKKYKNSENGLILKVTDVFVALCDSLIELNNQEKDYYNSLHQNMLNDDDFFMDRKEVSSWQQSINSQRKESMMRLLESSMLVAKVLVSSKADGYGELSYLAVTKDQKYNLLMLLDGFKGDDYQGALREGQSFLGGSISVIREILENKNYAVLNK